MIPTTTQLGVIQVTDLPDVPPAADYFGDPQYDVPHWNETTFFEAWSPRTGIGVFLHMGRYPKDLDLRWCQAITYLPGGAVTSDVHWGRNTDAGARTANLSIDVRDPLQHWTIRYDGAGELSSSGQLVQGLSGAGVQVPVRWHLEAVAAAPPWNLRPAAGGAMPDFAQSSHSQQAYRVNGTVAVNGTEHQLDGIGCNDHSRGARDLTHFAGDQWVVGVMPGYVLHVINVWRADEQPVLTTGAWFDTDGQRTVTAHRHSDHDIAGAPSEFPLIVDDGGVERRFAIEVLHGCTLSVTQQHDNLNGVGWQLPGDTVLLSESPIRLRDERGQLGYGHLERALRLNRATRPQ
ncbi:hypothetical protein [Mycobacterium sp.]|uniref:hypothetical protein n=1 Tax=Mycobacterium sp. TaxID=1785 RepID=UPI0011F960D3|nr:hypothetical protein [Mycobacterium sp.]TAM68128.1 MAG: hypothetical protein EPN51_12540 [Mycobacterium sp.]